LAEAYFRSGKLQAAAEQYRNAIVCAPLDDYYHICLAAAHWRAADFPDAEKVLRRTVRLRPDNQAYRHLLAQILEVNGATEKAGVEYARAGTLDYYDEDYVSRFPRAGEGLAPGRGAGRARGRGARAPQPRRVVADPAADDMIQLSLPVAPLGANCHVLACAGTRRAVVIDPGGDVPDILSLLAEHGLLVEHILLTHGHFDHCYGAPELQEATAAPIWLHQGDRELAERPNPIFMACLGFKAVPVAVDRTYAEGDRLAVGSLVIEVLHTPGHSPGSVCLRVAGHLVTGDTLFAGSVGRADLPGGDAATLARSLARLRSLPDELIVLPGHDRETTLGREKLTNPFLTGAIVL
jgi:glyoxylase-like metal-dependent hydrolase (beta-lactamase superfamily II)